MANTLFKVVFLATLLLLNTCVFGAGDVESLSKTTVVVPNDEERYCERRVPDCDGYCERGTIAFCLEGICR
nr:hypothetical protein [Tanacetum cinerariifolium]